MPQNMTTILVRALMRLSLTMWLGLMLASPAMAAVQVEVQTSAGDFVLELDANKAPKTVQNFLQYVNSKFYDNTLIHRVVTIGILVAQGGWLTPTPAVQPGQKSAIALEVNKGLSNLKGTIAMARSANLNSATS